MAPIIKVAGPNEALIRSGGGREPKVTVGGRIIVLPIFFKAQNLSLEVMTLAVETAKVYTKEGVAITVDGVAQVKVARAEEAIRTAAQQFIGKPQREIAQVALQTLEGAQRAILGTMTVEDIYQDRESFAQSVGEVAGPHMANMGLEIVSFTIRDIRDDQGYLDALGRKRTAEVTRDAEIGEAEATRDAAIRRAEAERDASIVAAQANRDQEAARFEADTSIAGGLEAVRPGRRHRLAADLPARRGRGHLAAARPDRPHRHDQRRGRLHRRQQAHRRRDEGRVAVAGPGRKPDRHRHPRHAQEPAARRGHVERRGGRHADRSRRRRRRNGRRWRWRRAGGRGLARLTAGAAFRSDGGGGARPPRYHCTNIGMTTCT